MKKIKPIIPQFPRSRAAALLLVLGSVALLAVLVVALLSLGRTENRASNAFRENMEVNSLAEIPVNLVISQLREATMYGGINESWASQPGMIRVFGKEAAPNKVRSHVERLHKLYSDDVMVWRRQSGTWAGDEVALDESDLAGWESRPAEFTNLNEPVAYTVDNDGNPLWKYPIVTMPAAGTVEGFGLTESAGLTKDYDGDGASDAVMPVKWLYVTEDGRMATPIGGDGSKVTFDPAVVNEDNRLVGRIAFWTDDESCKVNLNTSSEAVPWDVPRVDNTVDRNFAARMPAQNEFSRYPGHPATTSLSPILKAIGPEFEFTGDPASWAPRLQTLYAMLPQIPWGGSQGGTTEPVAITSWQEKRLYPSVDELFFQVDRTNNHVAITADKLDQIRFFLTAHSRASELNLFNKPKIMIWPMSNDPNDRNAKDKLLHFCGSNVSSQVFSTRGWEWRRMSNFKSETAPGSSQHPTLDYTGRNVDMMDSYLIHNTKNTIPGFPKLRPDGRVANFGGDPNTAKYKFKERQQFLTEMWDLLRWGANSYNTALNPKYRYLPARGDAGTNPKLLGETSAVPLSLASSGTAGISNGAPRGFGRWPTITEAATVFMGAEVARDANGAVMDRDGDGFADFTTKMQMYFLMEPFAPSVGMPSWTANVRYHSTLEPGKGLSGGTNAWQLKFSEAGGATDQWADPVWPASMKMRVTYATGWIGGGHSTAFTGMFPMFVRAYESYNSNWTLLSRTVGNRTNEDTEYTYASAVFDVPLKQAWGVDTLDQLQAKPAVPAAQQPRFTFEGGLLRLKVKTGWNATQSGFASGGDDVQEIEFNFPATQIAIPRVRVADVGVFTSLDQRLRGESNDAGTLRNSLIRDGDKVRSVEAAVTGVSKGDLRLVAALAKIVHFNKAGDASGGRTDYPGDTDITRCIFWPHPDYFKEDPNLGGTSSVLTDRAHGLRNSGYTNVQFRGMTALDTGGRLVKDITYHNDRIPTVARGLNGALNGDGRPGDWDTGVGNIEDGPYINKPDEGNYATGAGGGYFARGSFNVETGTTYSPNRQIPSPVVFGSLPSGFDPQFPHQSRPWQTLLFCPNPASRSTASTAEPTETDHKGFGLPRDHLLLDFFWMPIVEPYAISEPFSTGGKINLNYRMAPFSHIERSTAIYSLMKGVQVMAIEPSSASNYKTGAGSKNFRYPIHMGETLKGFEQRFRQGEIFVSGTEICELFLVPQSQTSSAAETTFENIVNWWNGSLTATDAKDLTGDNIREMPYLYLYPRVTTKSNVFTVHYHVQTLQQARTSDPSGWDEEKDRVLSAQRGSVLLERYLDGNDNKIDTVMVGGGTSDTWDKFYRTRVIRKRLFAP
jgi:uncharacterized protein (TIGR02600 family)